MANNFALLRYCSNNIRIYCLHFLFICDTRASVHLLLSMSFRLHESLEQNIKFVHGIPELKNNAFSKFSTRNSFRLETS